MGWHSVCPLPEDSPSRSPLQCDKVKGGPEAELQALGSGAEREMRDPDALSEEDPLPGRGSGVSRWPPAVCSFKVGTSLREPPLPRPCPSSRTAHAAG